MYQISNAQAAIYLFLILLKWLPFEKSVWWESTVGEIPANIILSKPQWSKLNSEKTQKFLYFHELWWVWLFDPPVSASRETFIQGFIDQTAKSNQERNPSSKLHLFFKNCYEDPTYNLETLLISPFFSPWVSCTPYYSDCLVTNSLSAHKMLLHLI